MSKDMLGVVVRKLVTLPDKDLGTVCDLLEKMSDPDWRRATTRFLRKEEPWPKIQEATSDLLEFVAEVELPKIDTFCATDHFKVDKTGEVAIGWIGDNFRRVFLDDGGRMERDVAKATLRVHRLLKISKDSLIIVELGGEEVAETTLAQMWEMMKVQGRGQKGNLLVNGYGNIFYIRDAQGTFWAVSCYWSSSDGYWEVGANPVTYPSEWYDGRQVVSR